jgi:type I restriction enzyme M protein
MALINLLFNSLKGEIAHMNSLSNEFFTGYKVCTTLVNGYHIPYTEFNEPGQSHIWLKPVKEHSKSAFTTTLKPYSLLKREKGREK